MGQPCIGFKEDRAIDAFEHFKGNLEVVEDYGDRCGGHFLHTWDDGCRLLLKCKACGGYVLLQKSEFHGFTGDDSYYSDYFPVSGPEEAAELNLKFSGDDIEHDFPGRYIMRDNLMAPHWSEGETFDPDSPEGKEALEHLMRNLDKIRQSIGDGSR